MYGGMELDASWFSDTWAYEHPTNTWTELSSIENTNTNTEPTGSEPTGETEFPVMLVAVPGVLAVVGVMILIVYRSRSKP